MDVVDVVALAIALLALGVGAASLGWQYRTWKRERALDISVKLYDVTNARPEDVDGRKVLTFRNELRILIANRTAFPVEVTAATVVKAGTTHIPSFFTQQQPLIPARDAESIYFDRELFSSHNPGGSIEPGDPVEAWVQLSTGHQYRSPPIVLGPLPPRTLFGWGLQPPTE